MVRQLTSWGLAAVCTWSVGLEMGCEHDTRAARPESVAHSPAPDKPAAPLAAPAPEPAPVAPWVWFDWPNVETARRWQRSSTSHGVLKLEPGKRFLTLSQSKRQIWSLFLDPVDPQALPQRVEDLGHGEHLFIARQTFHKDRLAVVAQFQAGSTRAAVMGIDLETGKLAWRKRLVLPDEGGIRTGAIATELQVHRNEGRWWVFGLCHAGRFAWPLDPVRGRIGERQRAMDLPKVWKAPPKEAASAKPPLSAAMQADGKVVFSRHPKRWSQAFSIQSPGLPQSFDVVLDDKAALLVAYPNDVETGQLIAADPDSGKLLWNKVLEHRIVRWSGPFAHKITLRVDDEDRIALWREASSGSIFELYRLRDGARLLSVGHP